MNVISSCSFACTAAFIYKRRRGPLRAFTGLFMRLGTDGCGNDVLEFSRSDLYGYPREAVVNTFPAFLPFNLLKGGLNTAITMLIYRPVITALRRHLIEADQNL